MEKTNGTKLNSGLTPEQIKAQGLKVVNLDKPAKTAKAPKAKTAKANSQLVYTLQVSDSGGKPVASFEMKQGESKKKTYVTLEVEPNKFIPFGKLYANK